MSISADITEGFLSYLTYPSYHILPYILPEPHQHDLSFELQVLNKN